jgi:hypothetical protein
VARRTRTTPRKPRFPALLVTGLLTATTAPAADAPRQRVESGPCPVSSGPPCAITLAGPGAPALSAECTSETWAPHLRFPQPERFSDSNGDGTWETVVEAYLDPTRDCGCVRFRVFLLEDELSGWIFHVGESPTNNGHGGDEGTTSDAAELHLLERKLTIYSVAQPVRRQIDRLLEVTLPPLSGRVLELRACDQSVDVELAPTPRDPEPAKWRLETLSSKLLFSLRPDQDGAPPKRGSIYAGFNRVIHLTTGPPSHKRFGYGVRRVEVSLTP